MAGWVIHDGANHQLVGFGQVAWIYIGWAAIGLWLASGIKTAAVAGLKGSRFTDETLPESSMERTAAGRREK